MNDNYVYLDVEGLEREDSFLYKRIGYNDVYAYLSFENEYANNELISLRDLATLKIILNKNERDTLSCITSILEDNIHIFDYSLAEVLKQVRDNQTYITLSVDSIFANPTAIELQRIKVDGLKQYYGLYYPSHLEERLDPFINRLIKHFNQ
ncbi:MAG: hypothetical protein ACI4WG_06585 [Erysipelotrichaceae bacterium]